MREQRLSTPRLSGKWVKVANLGFSVKRLVLGSITLAMACDDGGGEGVAETSDSSADSTADPSSAASDDAVDDGDDSADSPTTSADDSADDSAADTGVDEDVDIVELRVESFNVPNVETYYACFEFSFQLDQLGHIVEFTPKIDNTAHVHHFVLTRIEQPTGGTNGYSCLDLSGEMIWTWAPGGEGWKLPPEAGFLVGDAPGGNVTFRLQVHYNNPLGVTGQTDSSGLDLHVARTLREHNAGTMVFGDIQGIEIPPGMPAYEHVATCSSSATSAILSEPMHVFGTAMHAHDIGSVLWSDVLRGGDIAYELNRDEPYLFNSQHMNPVDLVIEPGDEVKTHCIYDSTERSGTTLGGPGTADEMCWNVVTYWPRVENPLDVCSSYN